VSRRSQQSVFSDNAFMAVTVGPNPVLQTMTAIRQMSCYSKMAACSERSGFTSDVNAEFEFMSANLHDFQRAKAFAGIVIVTQCRLLPK
jgi:hypothetical protein